MIAVVTEEFDALSGCFGPPSDESNSELFVLSGGLMGGAGIVVVPSLSRRAFGGKGGDGVSL